MNIQLGIYEIFSTIIPGIVYLAAIVELLRVLKIVPFEWRSLDNLSFISSLGLLVIAYLSGIAFSRFGIYWKGIFKTKDQSLDSLIKFKERQKDRWSVDIEDTDWHILLAYVRSKNLDLAREIERHLATSIMLRNVSFGVFLIALSTLVQFFRVRDIVNLIETLVFFILSLVMLRESGRFRHWYYDAILSTIVAYRVDLEKSIKPVLAVAPKVVKRKKNDK